MIRVYGFVLIADLCFAEHCYVACCYQVVQNNSNDGIKGGRCIGRDFDISQKIAVKFPTPGQKCEVKYN